MENDLTMPDFVALRPFAYGDADVEDMAEEMPLARPPAPVFRPTLPGDGSSRPVHRMDAVSSVEDGVAAHDLLANAWRRQELEAAASTGQRTATPGFFAGMSLNKFGLTTSGNVMGEGYIGGPEPPRRKKDSKEGRSMDLMDLAFAPKRKLVAGEERSNYTPISLPYYNFVEEAEMEASTNDNIGKREKMVHVDEANANMAKAMPQEGELFLMQIPSVLPHLADPSQAMKREGDDAASAGAGASITKVPDGRLGKLRVYKSGKVRMEIGGLEFCVDQGCETFFHQEIACVCPLAKEIVNLGSVSKRMVLTPDLDSMLKESAEVKAKETTEAKESAEASADVVMASQVGEPAEPGAVVSSSAGAAAADVVAEAV